MNKIEKGFSEKSKELAAQLRMADDAGRALVVLVSAHGHETSFRLNVRDLARQLDTTRRKATQAVSDLVEARCLGLIEGRTYRILPLGLDTQFEMQCSGTCGATPIDVDLIIPAPQVDEMDIRAMLGHVKSAMALNGAMLETVESELSAIVYTMMNIRAGAYNPVGGICIGRSKGGNFVIVSDDFGGVDQVGDIALEWSAREAFFLGVKLYGASCGVDLDNAADRCGFFRLDSAEDFFSRAAIWDRRCGRELEVVTEGDDVTMTATAGGGFAGSGSVKLKRRDAREFAINIIAMVCLDYEANRGCK